MLLTPFFKVNIRIRYSGWSTSSAYDALYTTLSVKAWLLTHDTGRQVNMADNCWMICIHDITSLALVLSIFSCSWYSPLKIVLKQLSHAKLNLIVKKSNELVPFLIVNGAPANRRSHLSWGRLIADTNKTKQKKKKKHRVLLRHIL